MDLRPKLADDFIEAIVKDISILRGLREGWDSFEPEDQDKIKAGWKKAILKRFLSHSLDLPGGDWCSESDPATIQAFIEKYPRIQGLIDLAKAEAGRRFENPTFTMVLDNDPESGHITHEGQSLSLKIQTNLNYCKEDGEHEGSPFDLADDAWFDWLCDDESPYYKLCQQLGDAGDLLTVSVESRADGE